MSVYLPLITRLLNLGGDETYLPAQVRLKPFARDNNSSSSTGSLASACIKQIHMISTPTYTKRLCHLITILHERVGHDVNGAMATLREIIGLRESV